MIDFIPDGYYFTGYVAADAKSGHGALEFEYRPVLADEQAKFQDETSGKRNDKGEIVGVTESEYLKARLALCAPRIRSWSMKDPDGKPVAYAPPFLSRLNPVLQGKVTAIVLGYAVSEVNPDKPNEKTPEEEAKN